MKGVPHVSVKISVFWLENVLMSPLKSVNITWHTSDEVLLEFFLFKTFSMHLGRRWSCTTNLSSASPQRCFLSCTYFYSLKPEKEEHFYYTFCWWQFANKIIFSDHILWINQLLFPLCAHQNAPPRNGFKSILVTDIVQLFIYFPHFIMFADRKSRYRSQICEGLHLWSVLPSCGQTCI